MTQQLQRQLGSEAMRREERKCAEGCGEKMKNFGYREVTVQCMGGLEIKLWARYYARN